MQARLRRLRKPTRRAWLPPSLGLGRKPGPFDGRSMPTHGLGRCDGHHRNDEFREPRSDLGPDKTSRRARRDSSLPFPEWSPRFQLSRLGGCPCEVSRPPRQELPPRILILGGPAPAATCGYLRLPAVAGSIGFPPANQIDWGVVTGTAGMGDLPLERRSTTVSSRGFPH